MPFPSQGRRCERLTTAVMKRLGSALNELPREPFRTVRHPNHRLLNTTLRCSSRNRMVEGLSAYPIDCPRRSPPSVPLERSPLGLFGRQAERSSDRPYRLHRRRDRHRGRQAGAPPVEGQAGPRLCRGHGARPRSGQQSGARPGEEARRHARGQRHQPALSKARPTSWPTRHLEGAAFDKAYVDNEVAYHKQVNGALETL